VLSFVLLLTIVVKGVAVSMDGTEQRVVLCNVYDFW